MPRWLKFLILSLVPLILASIPVAMQWSHDGSLEGFITDEVGPVARASVDVRNLMSGLVLHAESDAFGHYMFAPLRQGRYSLWVRAENHSSYWIPLIVIKSGEATRQDIQLTRVVQPTTMPPQKTN